MIRKKKETAWKKSRKFGDIKGGRKALNFSKIAQKYHSIEKPFPNEELPIFIEDNPSRDFFHPISIEEIADFLTKLPSSETKDITHIWLRKIKKTDFKKGETYQACFICGDGVNLIVFNSFPRDLRMYFGKKKPTKKDVKFYGEWEDNWIKEKGNWYLNWTKKNIKKYYLEHLLLHEIGHLIDSINKRFYSKTRDKQKEDFANNYATIWNNRIKETINLK
ncbi:MAG: hypothetical protein AAGJ18_00425 [Bacteroidota bacterium]